MKRFRTFRRWLAGCIRATPTRYATPTLKGLVETEGPRVGMFHRWDAVRMMPVGVWSVLQPSGAPLQDECCSKVRLRTRGYATAVALVAQRRCLRNRFWRGELPLTEKNELTRRFDLVMGFALLVNMGLLIAMMAWNPEREFRVQDFEILMENHAPLLLITLGLVVSLPALFVFLALWFIWLGVSAVHPKRLLFHQDSIGFEFADGSVVKKAWDELYSIEGFGFLRFLDGSRFRARPGPRGARILESAEKLFIERSCNKTVCRRIGARWLALSVAAGGVAALLQQSFPSSEFSPVWLIPGAFLLTLMGGIVSMAAATDYVDPISRWKIKRRRRVDRRKRGERRLHAAGLA